MLAVWYRGTMLGVFGTGPDAGCVVQGLMLAVCGTGSDAGCVVQGTDAGCVWYRT